MLRRPTGRPLINIAPRKRRRITYEEADDDDEGFLALREKEATDPDDSESENKQKEPVLGAEFEDEDSSDDEDFVPGGDEDLDEDVAESDEGFPENEDDGNRQLVVHADFEDDDEESDEDFEPAPEKERDEDPDGSLEEPNQDDDDSEEEQEKPAEPPVDEQQGADQHAELSAADEAILKEIKSNYTRTKILKLHTAFPETPVAVIKFVLDGSKGEEAEAYEALTLGFRPAKPKSILAQTSNNSSPPKARSRKRKSSVEEDMDLDGAAPEETDVPEDLLQHYDHHGLPAGSIKSGKGLSFMAEVATRGSHSRHLVSRRSTSVNLGKGLTSTPAVDIESQEVEVSEVSSDTTSGTSSSEDSNSSSEEESEDAEVSEDSSSDSESGSDNSTDSSSNDDSAPEESSSKLDYSDTAANTKKSSIAKSERAPHPNIPPGSGNRNTTSRNQRRRASKALARLKNRGILPESTTTRELRQLDVTEATSPKEAQSALQTLRSDQASAEIDGSKLVKIEEFEARRRELLASLTSGGIEVAQSSSRNARKSSSVIHQEEIISATVSNGVSNEVTSNPFSTGPQPYKAKDNKFAGTNQKMQNTEDAFKISSKPTTTPASAEQTQTQPGSIGSHRIKLDSGAARRLLFGALGVRAPKTKRDEEKVRDELMKGIRPLRTKKAQTETSIKATNVTIDEHPDAWREKVIYRAVECVQEGIILSEPPFPFIQRWDPQQRGSRSGKRKKDQRDQPQYYEDELRIPKKQKRRKGKNSYAKEQEYPDASYQSTRQDSLRSEEPTQETSFEAGAQVEINDQLMSDLIAPTNASELLDDLPVLPDDPSTLSNLSADEVKPGMVIAFKQLDMSETTKWQPLVSTYRTAEVVEVEGSRLLVKLAKRDQAQSAKKYDDSGNRIYSKFEAPDVDDEDLEELEQEIQDDGLVETSFGELIEPKVVTAAREPRVIESILGDAVVVENDSVPVSNVEEAQEAQFSHVTETTLDSDAPENPILEDMALSDLQETDIRATNSKMLNESISSDSRQHIQDMIKDAGFRSSIPSSVMRDIQLYDTDSPSDAAKIEKLRKDVLDLDGVAGPLSPKFNGFGSNSLLSNEVSGADSSVPPERLQSSWKTIGSQETSSLPAQEVVQMVEASLSSIIGTDSQRDVLSESVEEASQGLKEPRRQRSISKLLNDVAVKGAQALWEGLAPKGKPSSPVVEYSQAKSAKDSNPSVEADPSTNIPYPKLSLGSSFHSQSQVTDHGRQPDFDFDDNTNLTTDTPKRAAEELEISGANDQDDTNAEPEPELPPHKSFDGVNEDVKVTEIELSSDDPFPTLEDVYTQPQVKPRNPICPPSKTETKVHSSSKKIDTALSDEESDQSTPKASQSKRLKTSQSLASQAPRFSQFLSQPPPASQHIDLTLVSSSDAEPEPKASIRKTIGLDSDGEHSESFKNPLSFDTDEDEESSGWKAKKKRQTSLGLKGSSQSSLNAKGVKRQATFR